MGTVIFIIIAAFAVIVYKWMNSSNKQEKTKEPIQHFELMDENGNTISSSNVQKLKYFGIKDSGYYVSVWPKDQPTGSFLEFDIAGMSYRDNIDKYIGEHVGTLEAEPDNEYDPNAIKILVEDRHHVGYVPKDMTQHVRSFKHLPCTCYIYIGVNNDGNYYSDCYITDNP